MTERLAVGSSRRPWLTLAGWVVVLVAAIAITAAFVGDALSGDEEITSDTDSRRADELRSERFASERAGTSVTEVIVKGTPPARSRTDLEVGARRGPSQADDPVATGQPETAAAWSIDAIRLRLLGSEPVGPQRSVGSLKDGSHLPSTDAAKEEP